MYNQPPRWSDPAQTDPYSFQRSSAPQQPAQMVYAPVGRSKAAADERLFAMIAHLSAAIAWIVSAGWLNFVGPLVVWLLFRDHSPFVRRAAAGAFNFTIGMTIMGVVGWIMVFTIVLAPIGLILIALSGVLAIVLGVVGALRTWRGKSYDYPWQTRILS